MSGTTLNFSIGAVVGGAVMAAVAAGGWYLFSQQDAPAQAAATSQAPAPGAGSLPPGHPPLPGQAQPAAPRMDTARPGAAAGALPPGHPQVGGTQPAPAQPAQAQLEGEVLEVLQVPNYSYLRLRSAQGEVWTAVPTTDVKPGARVGIAGAFPMRQFASKSLGRTFEEIYFGTLAP